MTEQTFGRDQLSRRAVLQSVPLFAELPNHLMTVLLRRRDVVRPDPGSGILTEADRVESFYVLAAGEVSLTVHGEELATLTTVGDTIGLSSALRDLPSPETAVAGADTALLKFGSNEFWSLLTGSAQLVRAVMSGLTAALVERSTAQQETEAQRRRGGPVPKVLLALEEAEASSLRHLLGAVIGDMSMEIADTDNPNFRKQLKDTRDQLQRVLVAIDSVITPMTASDRGSSDRALSAQWNAE